MLTIDPTLLSVGSVWKYGPPEAHVQDTCLIHLVDKKKKTLQKNVKTVFASGGHRSVFKLSLRCKNFCSDTLTNMLLRLSK